MPKGGLAASILVQHELLYAEIAVILRRHF